MAGLIRKIATRFVLEDRRLLSKESRRFASFIASISIVGLALGVTALLVVTSVMNGFERELKQALTAFHGHILLFSRGDPVSNPEKYRAEILKEFPSVKAISPYVFVEAMLSSSRGASGVVIEGIDRMTFETTSQIAQKLTQGRLPQSVRDSRFAVIERPANGLIPVERPSPYEVVLSSEVARKLRVKLGDTILLTLPFAKEENAPLVQKLSVVGIFHLGMYDYDSKYVLMEISDVQKLLSMDGKVNAFKLLTEDPANSLQLTQALNDKFVYPLRARDWSSLNQNIFYAIRLEKIVISIILMAIVLVASFNIISTIMMLVHDKKKQISMLKALGFPRHQTLYLFLLIGAVMSTLGMVLGLGLGRAICGMMQWRSFIDLPGDVYVLSRIPIEIRPLEWAGISLFTVMLAVLSSFWPSFWISRESPVEGLRYE